MKVDFQIEHKLKQKLSKVRLGYIFANVKVFETSTNINKLVAQNTLSAVEILKLVTETNLEIIEETRSAYKICGKQPSRYRPSAEALLRRIRTGKDLYRVNNIVDIINILSISSHYSIGGFDVEKIKGDIVLDIGDNSPYKAIGRGELNIEFMPGLKDDLGFFGTPTSDSERTMVTPEINQLLLVYYDFYGNSKLEDALNEAQKLLKEHCKGENIVIGYCS